MKLLLVALLCSLSTGCRGLQFGESLSFEAGRSKEEKPYDEGVWVGPVALDAAEKEVFAAGDGHKNRMGWLMYDTNAEWKKLKAMLRPGDQIWRFQASPYVVDGGDRYFGFSLVRDRMIVACVITNVIE